MSKKRKEKEKKKINGEDIKKFDSSYYIYQELNRVINKHLILSLKQIFSSKMKGFYLVKLLYAKKSAHISLLIELDY